MGETEQIEQYLNAHLADESRQRVEPQVANILTGDKYAAIVEKALRNKWNSIPIIHLTPQDVERLSEIKKRAFNKLQTRTQERFRFIVSTLSAAAVTAGLVYLFLTATSPVEPTARPTAQTTPSAPLAPSTSTPTLHRKRHRPTQRTTPLLPVAAIAPLIATAQEPILEPILQKPCPTLCIPKQLIHREAIKQPPQQVVVAEGSTRKILMEDGSTIKVLGGSTLTILETNNSNERRVALSGKANFEVAHNPQRPFVIETQSITVQVLGTSFALSAAPSETTDRIRLQKGSVEIRIGQDLRYRLKPGETLSYNRETLGLTIH